MIQRKMMGLSLMAMRTWRNRVWIGKTWNAKLLQMIVERREMATNLFKPRGPRDVAARGSILLPLGIKWPICLHTNKNKSLIAYFTIDIL